MDGKEEKKGKWSAESIAATIPLSRDPNVSDDIKNVLEEGLREQDLSPLMEGVIFGIGLVEAQ